MKMQHFIDNVLLILVGKMWRGLVDWARLSMLNPVLAVASKEDLDIPQCFDTADEAIAAMRAHHAAWKAAQ